MSKSLFPLNNAQKAMIRKDIKEVLSSPQTALPMLIVPLLMMVLMPIGLMIGAQFGVSGMNGIEALKEQLSFTTNYENDSQLLIDIGVNYMFPALFLLIPIMAATVMGASSFVGEKEHKTLESLLYTPLSLKEIFVSKVVGTALVAYAAALISLLAFGLVVDIGGWFYFGRLIFPNLRWLLLIFWVAPAVTVLCIGFMVRVSAKANTFQEAQQMSVFVILPVVFLLIGQTTGLFMLSTYLLLGLGGVLYVMDYFLLKNAIAHFTPETML